MFVHIFQRVPRLLLDGHDHYNFNILCHDYDHDAYDAYDAYDAHDAYDAYDVDNTLKQ